MVGRMALARAFCNATRCTTVDQSIYHRDAAARRRGQRAFEEQLEAASMVGGWWV